MAAICKTHCPVGPRCEARKHAVLSREDSDQSILLETMSGMEEYSMAQKVCGGIRTSWKGWLLRGLAGANFAANSEYTIWARDEFAYQEAFPACGSFAARLALKGIPAVAPQPDPAPVNP